MRVGVREGSHPVPPPCPGSPPCITGGVCLCVLGLSVGVLWHVLWLLPADPTTVPGLCQQCGARHRVCVCVCVCCWFVTVAQLGWEPWRGGALWSACLCAHSSLPLGSVPTCHVPVSPGVPEQRGSVALVCAHLPPSLLCLCVPPAAPGCPPFLPPWHCAHHPGITWVPPPTQTWLCGDNWGSGHGSMAEEKGGGWHWAPSSCGSVEQPWATYAPRPMLGL